MPLSRSSRMDRRRQLILDATEHESDSVEGAIRARRKTRRTSSEQETDSLPIKRDAGYSQDVRSTCQQRLVQLIPVRRSSLTLVVVACVSLWTMLMGAHYLIHVTGSDSLRLLPISYLFHLRSYYGIPHWLSTQLWMLTGIMAIMIYQLRKHKLDDYRASYRVWLALAAAALFASLDSSTSGLRLLGDSIDGWAKAELGYSGWSVVLATFAAMIGVLGLRLCGELQSAPFAVALWLGGLVSWGISALVGTGLLRTSWSPASTDMIVGGCWLGGILAVWLSAGIYLRHVYLHAHRRFLTRGGLVQSAPFRLPSWKWPLALQRESSSDAAEPLSAELRPSMMNRLFKRKSNDLATAKPKDPKPTKEKNLDSAPAKEKRLDSTRKPMLASWFAKKQKPAADQDTDDEGMDEPLSRPSERTAPAFAQESKRQEVEPASKTKPHGEPSQDNRASDESGTKKSWFPLGRKAILPSKSENKPAPASTPKSQPAASSNKEAAASKEPRSWWPGRKATTDKDPKTTEGTSSIKSSTPSAQSDAKAKAAAVKPKSKEPTSTPDKDGKKKGLFSFMDGFKLRPPVDGEEATKPATTTSNPPPPKATSTPFPSTRPTEDDEDEDDDRGSDGRGISKADRKRMRREQQNQRRAA